MNQFSIAIVSTAAALMSSAFTYGQQNAGYFEAEGQKIDTRFVRVLYAGEGSEDGTNRSTRQLSYESTDPAGHQVTVYRFQIVAKNTGYNEVQTSKEEDFKLKKVQNGVKLHIEVPVINGQMQLEKAYIGNLAYNFGSRETRNILSAETVSDIRFDLRKLDLPTFTESHHPGDNGIIYNQGHIQFTLTCNAKYINGEQTGPFIVSVDAPISVTHVRGQERESRAVSIDQDIVKKNK